MVCNQGMVRLTRAEKRLIDAWKGESQRELARRLGLSRRTVRETMKRIVRRRPEMRAGPAGAVCLIKAP